MVLTRRCSWWKCPAVTGECLYEFLSSLQFKDMIVREQSLLKVGKVSCELWLHQYLPLSDSRYADKVPFKHGSVKVVHASFRFASQPFNLCSHSCPCWIWLTNENDVIISCKLYASHHYPGSRSVSKLYITSNECPSSLYATVILLSASNVQGTWLLSPTPAELACVNALCLCLQPADHENIYSTVINEAVSAHLVIFCHLLIHSCCWKASDIFWYM